jgi:hypothetical protein
MLLFALFQLRAATTLPIAIHSHRRLKQFKSKTVLPMCYVVSSGQKKGNRSRNHDVLRS